MYLKDTYCTAHAKPARDSAQRAALALIGFSFNFKLLFLGNELGALGPDSAAYLYRTDISLVPPAALKTLARRP